MSVHPSQCPSDPDDKAERYCMNTLPAGEREAFEEHARQCEACARILRDTTAYIVAMRAAAKEFRNRE